MMRRESMRTLTGLGWASLGVVFTFGAGCGSSETNTTHPTNGGSAGNASGSAGQQAGGSAASGAGMGGAGGSQAVAGASGSAGGLTFGNSLTEACIAYALAVCERGIECRGGGTSSNCLSSTLGCPDIVTSPGSTRTVATLQACAAAYRTFSCDALAAGQLPPCVTPGTRQRGEPCAYHSQCASLTCKKSAGCGVCASIVGEGQDCSAPDTDCSPELRCDTSQLPVKCVPKLGASSPPALPGQPCVDSCVRNYYCDKGGAKVCVLYPQEGMSCQKERSCATGSYCELDSLICKALPGKAAACGVDSFTGQAAYCADGLVCHKSTKSMGICETPPVAGQPCLIDPETQMPAPNSCGVNTRCDAATMPAVCTPLGGPGADCTANGSLDCASGLTCMCPPDAPPNQPCATRSCYSLRYAGQRCDEPGSACHPGFACSAGKCVPKDSQGLFAAACKP
jgi:hypothetical protein